MFRKLIFLCTLATFLAACSAESPLATASSSEPDQPVIATPIATELPPTDTTPVMVEPPERGAPKPINSDYLPQRGDGSLTRGNVLIDNSDLLIMESYPIQVALTLQGSLPTPCNQLRVIAKPPDEQNRIQVDVYSVIDPEQLCVQVLEPFEVNIGLGSFPIGHYSVWVNGEQIGEFDA
jgi:inhibitor of cysteine peptidase